MKYLPHKVVTRAKEVMQVRHAAQNIIRWEPWVPPGPGVRFSYFNFKAVGGVVS